MSERIFNISNWRGVNEAPEGEARLKLGEAAVMRNFCVTSGGALKKRPGSRNVAGLLAKYSAEVREGSRLLLITDKGLSDGYPMYPRMMADDAGTVRTSGSPVTVTSETAAAHKGYFYESGGKVYALSECVSRPGTGSESIVGGRATPGTLTQLASGTERRTGSGGSQYTGARYLDTRAEAYIRNGEVNVRGADIRRDPPMGARVGFETTNAGGYVLQNGVLYRYYGVKVDSYKVNASLWRKYKCIVTRNGYSYYTEGPFELQYTFPSTSNSNTGWTSYRFDSSSGIYSNSGMQVTIRGGESGTIYQADNIGSGNFCVKMVITRTSSTESRATGYASRAQGPVTGEDVSYARGADMGTVSVPEGKRPEESGGYTYVDTFSYAGAQYTVMRSGDDYYCYAKDESAAATEYERAYSFHGCPLTVSADTNEWYFAETFASYTEPGEITDKAVRGIWSGFVGGREVLCAACGGRL